MTKRKLFIGKADYPEYGTRYVALDPDFGECMNFNSPSTLADYIRQGFGTKFWRKVIYELPEEKKEALRKMREDKGLDEVVYKTLDESEKILFEDIASRSEQDDRK